MEVNSREEGFLKISNKNNGSNQINLKMELNTYKTKLLSDSKAMSSGTGPLLSIFCQRLPKWGIFNCYVLFNILSANSQVNLILFSYRFFQKIPHATVSVFLGFADR